MQNTCLPALVKIGLNGTCLVNIFFAIFNLYPEWGWHQLPNEYLNSAYLSTDTDALQSNFSLAQPEDPFSTQELPEEDNSTTSPVVDKIPTHKVL